MNGMIYDPTRHVALHEGDRTIWVQARKQDVTEHSFAYVFDIHYDDQKWQSVEARSLFTDPALAVINALTGIGIRRGRVLLHHAISLIGA